MFDALTEGPDQEKKVLRVHQERGIALCRDAFRQGYRRVILKAPTGFGKTLTAARMVGPALERGKRVLFTAGRIKLINQTIGAFQDDGVTSIGAIQAQHGMTDPSARVQIASVKTLARRDIPSFDFCIVDECHENAEVVNRLLDENPEKFFIGLSATPWARGMGNRWQHVVEPITMGELIEQGFLSQYEVFAPSVPDLSGVATRHGEYVESQLEEVMGDAPIMGDIVQNWLAHGENRPTLVFAVNRAHAAQIQEAFTLAGVSAAYVDGKVDSVERDTIEAGFRSGEIKVVVSILTMTTGVDLPISCIIDAAPTKSIMLHVQKLGRGFRVNEGTEGLTVFDHAGNCIRLGFPDQIEGNLLDKTKPGERGFREAPEREEALPKPCPAAACNAVYTGLICPSCGHEKKPPRIEAAKGDLVQISGKKKKHSAEEKQAFWSMALWVARKRGYQKGWASHLYRDKFGVWPKNLSEIEKQPDLSFSNYEKSRRIARAKSKQRALP